MNRTRARERASKEPRVTVNELSCCTECWRGHREVRSPSGREAWKAQRNQLVTVSGGR